MNNSTAAFLGISPSPAPVGYTAIEYAIRSTSGHGLYVTRFNPATSSFGYDPRLDVAKRFGSAEAAAQAIQARQREFGADVPDHFVIVTLKVTETPGAEITKVIARKPSTVTVELL